MSRASSGGTAASSTPRHTTGARRLLSEAAKRTSRWQMSEATASGLRMKTIVSDCAISASMRFHQSSSA
ncbi:MAG TPA: hypothetical protein VK432_08415 [Stellaceae bacterium]|nr:hypothetical protein [Stellaceae bacterium]